MGDVFRAVDRVTGETVALKCMRHALSEGAERFVREGQLLATLSHQAIVRHVGHGIDETGCPCLAMEWLKGEDLEQRLARERLSADSRRARRRAAFRLSFQWFHVGSPPPPP